MPQLDQHSLYELDILEHVEKTPRLNNRLASKKLGVSIKLAHELLKRMVQKGLLHINVVNSRRWDYFLTPKGIAEKARLTMEFLDFSMHFYREARRRSSQVCRDLAEEGLTRVAFIGAGDLAEIVYLGVQEWGLELVAVYDDASNGNVFLGKPVRSLAELSANTSDATIVCLYDSKKPMRGEFLPPGITRRPGMHWVFRRTSSNTSVVDTRVTSVTRIQSGGSDHEADR